MIRLRRERRAAHGFDFTRFQYCPAFVFREHFLFPRGLGGIEFRRLGFEFGFELFTFGFELAAFFFLFGRWQIQDRFFHPARFFAAALIAVFVACRIKEGIKLVIILLRKRIVFVIVALRAAQRRAEPHRRSRVHPIHQKFQSVLLPGQSRLPD